MVLNNGSAVLRIFFWGRMSILLLRKYRSRVKDGTNNFFRIVVDVAVVGGFLVKYRRFG